MKKVVSVVAMLLVCMVALCACTPSKDNLEKKFKDEGYLAISVPVSDYGDYDVDYAFGATKLTESITVIAFKNGSDAKDFYNKCKENGDKKNLAKKGNAVAWGTEGAIKLFK
ncbi:MAG: hypothetical protein J1F36_01740 [Clostridiales bacterium]|nr:hypothetical protein [Clostridiales bacterium]